MTTTPDTGTLRAAIDAAHEHVCDLAEGKTKWTMRIPADEARDSDLVISAGLAAGVKALDALAAAERETADLRRQLALAEEEITARREDRDQAWRDRDSLARRCALRFQETQLARTEAAQYRDERDAARAEVAELTQQRDQARRSYDLKVAELARETAAVEVLARVLLDDNHSPDGFHAYGDRCRHCAALKEALRRGPLAVPVPAGDTSHDEATGVYPPPSERDLCWKPVTAEDGYVENCGLWEGHRPPCLLVCGDCCEGRCHIPVRPPRPGVGDPDCGCARHADSLRAYHLGDDDAAPASVAAHAGQDETVRADDPASIRMAEIAEQYGAGPIEWPEELLNARVTFDPRRGTATPAVVPPHTYECALVASDGNAPCDCRVTSAAAPAVLPPTPTAGSNSGEGDTP